MLEMADFSSTQFVQEVVSYTKEQTVSQENRSSLLVT
jgi:hypothetical protein